MRYFWIDGYNLLFNWSEETQSLENRRSLLVQWIQQAFAKTNQRGTIVFDGAHRTDEEYGLSYPSPMEVAFSPRGQSADLYILEQVEQSKNKKILVVVTNDQTLKRHVSSCGATVMSNQAFLHWLLKHKHSKKEKKTVIRETPFQVERLIKIFEERLKENLDD